MNRAFLEMHGHATACACKFNQRLRRDDVSFVDASVYLLLTADRKIAHCFNAETHLRGKYTQFNDNAGNVYEDGTTAGLMAQAFSHFSYDFAGGKSIIVDIQGSLASGRTHRCILKTGIDMGAETWADVESGCFSIPTNATAIAGS